jgi:hypothetical protein
MGIPPLSLQADFLPDFARLGEPAQFLLGEDQLAVVGDLEDPARRGLQFDREVRVDVLKLSRQTDGLLLVASHRAVFDMELVGHGNHPP